MFLCIAAGLERAPNLSNEMGLFLQKVNIIRDYREDIDEARIFWPRAVWYVAQTACHALGELVCGVLIWCAGRSKYTDKLDNFKEARHSAAAVAALNDLITNALHHAPQCLQYMQQLQDRRIFSFCAIPQVMAIATLAVCYNNPRVFDSVVKIRRGTAAKMILESNDMHSVNRLFYDMARVIEGKIDPRDANAERTRVICRRIQELTKQDAGDSGSPVVHALAWVAFAASSAYLLHRNTNLFRSSKV